MRSGVQPLFSFTVIVVLGIIIATKINSDENLVAPIILLSVIFGFTITIFELRMISRQPRASKIIRPMTEDERQQRLALMVAEVFEEDFVEELKDKAERASDLDPQDPQH